MPGILRSIYAYHVKSRGWSDIGYNFLVDRFGRIWEGRYGGIDKAVVGAHTLGYNDYAFAMSAIGNFDVVQPPEVMLQAYGALFAWKLGLHGVNPASMSQQVGRTKFAAINGHRDAGSTACPGRYLYAKLANIRAYAVAGGTPRRPRPRPLRLRLRRRSRSATPPRSPTSWARRTPTWSSAAPATAAASSSPPVVSRPSRRRPPSRPRAGRTSRTSSSRPTSPVTGSSTWSPPPRRACSGSGPARATHASRRPPRSSSRPAATP